MTIRELVKQKIRTSHRSLVEDEIVALIEMEREKCATIADKYGLDGDIDDGGNADFMDGYRNAARGIADEIREFPPQAETK